MALGPVMLDLRGPELAADERRTHPAAGVDDLFRGERSAILGLDGFDPACVVSGVAPDVAADPGLAPLAENGGPTLTHALLPGSPAINNGNTALPTDQRGVPRPVGPADDIGAVEQQYVIFLPAMLCR